MKRLIATSLLCVCLAATALGQSRVAGQAVASEYAKWTTVLQTGVASSAQTMKVAPCLFNVAGGTTIFPFSTAVRITITDGASTETVTPTAVTAPVPTVGQAGGYTCTITATLTYAHAAGVRITSGDGGINEAIADIGAGEVILTPGWGSDTAVSAIPITTANVLIVDRHGPPSPRYWSVQPSVLTALATPATRSASAGATQVVSGTATGTWTADPVYVCVTYVDILGGESPCSATYNFTATLNVALNFAAPAASTGAVGWRAYAGASYAAAYQLPISASTCTLSTKTPYPTCAIGSAGVFLDPTTATGLAPAAGGVAATYKPNTQSHTTFAFQPTNNPSSSGLQRNYGPFIISPALTAGQAVVLGTIPLPTGYLNYVGRSLRITGKVTVTPSTQGSVQLIVGIGNATDFSTGTPKALCTLTTTGTITAAAYDGHFQCDLTVNATGASGTIMPEGFSIFQVQGGTTTSPSVAVESGTAAITADVTAQSTLNIEFLQTSAAESTTPPHLVELHIEEL